MNANLQAGMNDLWLIAGWTMIHFLWLGTLVGVAAALSRLALRSASANLRYTITLAWLLALAALPFATAIWLLANSPPSKGGARGGIPATSLANDFVTLDEPRVQIHDGDTVLTTQSFELTDNDTALSLNAANSNDSKYSIESLTFATLTTLQACIPYLPLLWLIGTPTTLALLLTGIVGSRRLNRASHQIIEGPIAAILARLTTSLHITRQVTVAVCDRIASPVLIGIIRPVILLPPSALTGWSPDEIEMVLLHELAHVRRWDNLVNLLQRFIESLLFFHPAVWMISTWVRRDRESCCDTLVVGRTGRPHAYAEMLVALAAQMPRSVLFHPAASSAMAAGPLRYRIRRILQLEDDPMLVSGKSLTIAIVVALVVGTLTMLYAPSIGHAEPSTEPDPIAARSASKGSSDVVPESPAPTDKQETAKEFPYEVKFERGAKRFLEGDEIEILEVRGSADTFKTGNKYWIRGTYKLHSHDHANLSAYVTSNDDSLFPYDSKQTTAVKRGEGTFELILPYYVEGWPHASFYPTENGQGFGGNYFGTGDSVLKKWGDANQPHNAFQLAFELKQDTAGNVDLYLNGKQINRDELQKSITQYNDWQNKPVSLSADRSIDYKAVMDLIDQFESIGVKKLALDTRSIRSERSSPTDAEVIARAWQILGLRLAPMTPEDHQKVNDKDLERGKAMENYEVKITGVAAPATLESAELPYILNNLRSPHSHSGSKTLGDVADVLDKLKDNDPVDITYNAIKDGKLWQFDLVVNVRLEPQPDSSNPLSQEQLPPGAAKFSCAKALPSDISAKDFASELDVILSKPEAKNKTILFGVPAGIDKDFQSELATLVSKYVSTNRIKDFADAQIQGDRLIIFYGEAAKPAQPALQPGAAPPADASAPSKFPSLEEQKLADIAYKALGLELEPIGPEDLKRVKALGYDGGVEVTGGNEGFGDKPLQTGDILLGLHVWPTTTVQDIADILSRSDIAQLNPLKYRSLTQTTTQVNGKPETKDTVIQGRIRVELGGGFGGGRTRPIVDGAGQSRLTPAKNQNGLFPRTPTMTTDATVENRNQTPANQIQPKDPFAPQLNNNSPTQPATQSNPFANNQPAVTTSDRYSSPSLSSPAPGGMVPGRRLVINSDTASDRTVVAYEVPASFHRNVEKYANEAGIEFLWDQKGRCIIQASDEQHKRFKNLLDSTSQWRKENLTPQAIEKPFTTATENGDAVLRWRAAGLNLVCPHSSSPVIVKEVAPGSPAAWLDVQPGDALTRIERFNVSSLPEAESIFSTLTSGFNDEKNEIKIYFVRLPATPPKPPYMWKSLPLKPLAESKATEAGMGMPMGPGGQTTPEPLNK